MLAVVFKKRNKTLVSRLVALNQNVDYEIFVLLYFMIINIRRLVNIFIINIFPINLIFKKFVNLVKFLIASKFKTGSINYLPISMDIEPTTGCNFRCTMCQVSLPDFAAKNMDLETFKKVIDDNPQLLKIKLQGMGETLVQTQIFDMMNYAKSHGIVTETTTNGSLLNKKNVELLKANKLSKITVSIDGATKSTFESIRVDSNFDEVIKGVSLLVEQCNKNLLRPQISAWCVLQNKNYHEIFKVFDLCRKIGFDDLTFQIQLSSWGQDYWVDKNKSMQINFNAEQVQEDFEKIRNLGKKNNFNIRIFEENALNFDKQCQWPFRSSYVSVDGSVVPCAPISDPKVVTMGNIKETSYEKIWKSKAYDKLRDNIRKNNLDNYCKDCYREYR